MLSLLVLQTSGAMATLGTAPLSRGRRAHPGQEHGDGGGGLGPDLPDDVLLGSPGKVWHARDGHQVPPASEWLTRERLRRGTKDEDSKSVQQYMPGIRVEFPRPINPASLQPTKPLVPSSTDPAEHRDGTHTDLQGTVPRGNLPTAPDKRLQIQNPLYPVTENSYSAYAVMFLSLIVFAVGIIGNLSVMCIVWHSYYLKSAWNAILASLALWDFLVLFFCLPMVIFNEITKKRLLGDISCRIVPFMEVRGRRGLRQMVYARSRSAICPVQGPSTTPLSVTSPLRACAGVVPPYGPAL